MTQRPPQQSILSFLNRSRRRDVELDQTHAPRSGANASNGLNTSSSRSSPIGSNPSNSPLDYSSTPSGRRRYSGQTSQNGQNGSQKTVPPSFDLQQPGRDELGREPSRNPFGRDPYTLSDDGLPASYHLDSLLEKLQTRRPRPHFSTQPPDLSRFPEVNPSAQRPRQNPVSFDTPLRPLRVNGKGEINPGRPNVVPLHSRPLRLEPKRSDGQRHPLKSVDPTLPETRPSDPKPSEPKRPVPPRSRKQPPTLVVYGIRLLILGVGVGVLAGTGLSILNSLGQPSAKASSNEEVNASGSGSVSQPLGIEALPLSLQLNQELNPLKQEVLDLVKAEPELKPRILMVDLDTGSYVDIDSQSVISAASTIKLPILAAFFQAVDAGQIQLDEKLTLEDRQIAGGSGDVQHQSPGTRYTALTIATKMITVSDNTATNMLIDRLGGAEALNQKFKDWGLNDTVIRNPLPDLQGTNKTSARDLVNLLTQLNQAGLVSMKSRDRLFHILQQTENDALIPSGLGNGAIAAHKTGNLKSVAADVGLIDLPNGKRYLLAVLVERSNSDSAAESLIRDTSQIIYQYFAQKARQTDQTPEEQRQQQRQ